MICDPCGDCFKGECRCYDDGVTANEHRFDWEHEGGQRSEATRRLIANRNQSQTRRRLCCKPAFVAFGKPAIPGRRKERVPEIRQSSSSRERIIDFKALAPVFVFQDAIGSGVPVIVLR